MALDLNVVVMGNPPASFKINAAAHCGLIFSGLIGNTSTTALGIVRACCGLIFSIDGWK